MDETQKNTEASDEANLDKEIESMVAEVQAGKVLDVNSTNQTGATGPEGSDATGETGATGPTGETGATGGENGEPATADKGSEFRIPNKGKFESDEAYEKRIELFDLVKRRKAATTPEAKQAITDEISKAKGELKVLGEKEKNYSPNGDNGAGDGSTEDPSLKADRDRLKELGGATKEDIAEVIRQERVQEEAKANLKSFVDRHADLKDDDMREVFFEFVDQNYVWEGKSGKALTTVLELAHEAMFKPAETIQERVLKGADVAEKVNAMQFPGGTGGGGSGNSFSPEQKRSIEELKATGLSEDKAIELIS